MSTICYVTLYVEVFYMHVFSINTEACFIIHKFVGTDIELVSWTWISVSSYQFTSLNLLNFTCFLLESILSCLFFFFFLIHLHPCHSSAPGNSVCTWTEPQMSAYKFQKSENIPGVNVLVFVWYIGYLDFKNWN